MKTKVIYGKGKEWSAVSHEVEDNFRSWLAASGMDKAECARRLDAEDFSISFVSDYGRMEVHLEDGSGEIGLPLIWHTDSPATLPAYMLDAALMLACMRGLCGNRESKEKIREAVREIIPA